MKGKVCLITGATSGIGRATAIALAKMNARVVFTARDEEKAKIVQDEIRTISGNQAVDFIIVDLASQASIKNLALKFKEKYQTLHVLINNAGAVFSKKYLTEDGIEKTFAINYLSRFLLTNLLLEVLKKSAPARIINVAGAYHTKGEIYFDDINLEQNYSSMRANNQSKLADVLFTYKLAQMLETTGITVNCLHPGAVRTGAIYKDKDATIFMKTMYKFFSLLIKSPEKGAETSVYLASSSEVSEITGKYFVNKKAVKSADKTYDKKLQNQLWELSTRLTHLE